MTDHKPPHELQRSDAAFDAPARYDDEISLYDLWDILVRRLPVIIGVGGIIVFAGLAYALSQPVTYEYRSGMELAHIYDGGSMRSLVSKDASIARLEDVIISQARDERFGDEEGGPRVEVVERGGDGSLVLKSATTQDQADTVADLHESIITALGEAEEPRFEQSLSARLLPHENKADMLEEEIGLLREQLSVFMERLGSDDGVNGLVIAQQMGDLRREITHLRAELVDARSAIDGIADNSALTEPSYIASESESPTGTGRSLIVALSVVLGGMLGLFAAFFWEFVSNARARRA